MERLRSAPIGPIRPLPSADRGKAPLRGRQWIFGYGSLAHVASLSAFLARHRRALGISGFGELVGFKRAWSVAMDNRQTLPGYKYYLDPVTGARPQVFVAFANIEPQREGSIAGIVFEVDGATLELFDSRERNYQRVDVTAHLANPVEGAVWTYIGHRQASDRFQRGLRNNTLVIDKAYAQGIWSAFAHAGLRYEAALPRHVPLVELTRIDT